MTIVTKNFKLLAIRPLDGCPPNFTRSLHPDELYKFLQNYKFLKNEEGNIVEIIADREVEQLYNQSDEFYNDIIINVSAVVGENGSGKSSLLELLYLTIYVLAVEQELLLWDEDSVEIRHEKLEYEKICSSLSIELFYEIDELFYCLRIVPAKDERKFSTFKNIQLFDVLKDENIPVEKLFYSIAINYSIYGLNERSSGLWLSRLFHKNDGYRTPVVINPFRDWGNIDVVSEAHLAQSRLLANLVPSADKQMILSNRAIDSVKFNMNTHRIRTLGKFTLMEIIQTLKELTGLDEDRQFESIYKAILGVDYDKDEVVNVKYRRSLRRYVIKKVIKIVKNYKEFRDPFYIELGAKRIPSINNFHYYLSELAKDSSHITLKLRQALNTYRFNMLRTGDLDQITREDGYLVISIKELSRRILEAHSNFKGVELVEFIPTAMLMPTIVLNDGSNFVALSSGEQQFIHSMQSVIYHLNNLNSVFSPLHDRVTFDHINIVLDEIELYFHPEFQRRYVFELLDNIRKMNIPNIKAINIVFLTHSPFILSDIPSANILKLKAGSAIIQVEKSFAGNIHTMLSDSFFMKSTIGEFAKKQYLDVIKFYDKVRGADDISIDSLKLEYIAKRPLFYFLVENIGEDVLSGILENHLFYLDKRLVFFINQADPEILRLLEARRQIDSDLKKIGYDQD